MSALDLADVLAIEARTFRAEHAHKLLSEELEREWARLAVARTAPGGPIVGYINYWIVRDEIHLLGIATAPDRRGQGFAKALLASMFAAAQERRCSYITLEVRKSNEPAIALYRAHGFEAVAVRPNYYVEDREDALVMVLELPATIGD